MQAQHFTWEVEAKEGIDLKSLTTTSSSEYNLTISEKFDSRSGVGDTERRRMFSGQTLGWLQVVGRPSREGVRRRMSEVSSLLQSTTAHLQTSSLTRRIRYGGRGRILARRQQERGRRIWGAARAEISGPSGVPSSEWSLLGLRIKPTAQPGLTASW